MDSDTDADESVVKTELEIAQEQLRIAKEQIETYQLLNRDLSSKVQEFKLGLNAANCEIALLRDNLMQEKIKGSELRRTLRVMHGKFTIFYGDYAALMKRCVENTDLDLTVTNELGAGEARAHLYKPPSRMQGNFTNNETNVLNTIREEQESRLSSITGISEPTPQVVAGTDFDALDIEYESAMFTPETNPMPVEASAVDATDASVVSTVLKPRVFMNHSESNISFFSVASDATSTPLQTLNVQLTTKPPSTIMEEDEDDSSQNVRNGLIGETPRRKSADNNIRLPPVRRISEESLEDDETPIIEQPEGSVEREMRKVFGNQDQSSKYLDELAERVGSIDSSSDTSEASQSTSQRTKRRNAILPERRKSSYVVKEILDEIQEEANTSNKENSLPSPQRTLEEQISPSKPIQPQKSKQQAASQLESPSAEAVSQASTSPAAESPRKRRGRPRRVAEIASDDEEEPPKKIQKSPPKKTQKSPPKKIQKSPPKKTQKSTPKKSLKTPTKKAQSSAPKKLSQNSPAKTSNQRIDEGKPEDGGSGDERQPAKRSKTRRKPVESSSDDDEDFQDAQPEVQPNLSDDAQNDGEHEPVTRTCSVELSQLNPSDSMLEVFKKTYIPTSSANSERASSVETVADSENGEACGVTKRPSPRKRDLSADSDRSEASSVVSMASTLASTSSQAATTTRKRKPKVEPVRKSRPPRRKARLAPGSLVEKSLLTKLRRSK